MEILTARMSPRTRARHPFLFKTCLILPEATGLRAATLPQLARLLQEVPEGCIYHHTHDFVLSHHYLSHEPTNDFAYWTRDVLGEEALSRRLAELDIVRYASLEALRETVVRIVNEYLQHHPLSRFKFAGEGEEFFFVKSIRVIMPTRYTASTLAEFADGLQRISVHALYFHIFGVRLGRAAGDNDVSNWLEQELGESTLAKEIAALDPYAHSLEALRSLLLSLISQRLQPVGEMPDARA